MISNEDLVRIDAALETCGELRMSSKEERWLEHSKEQVNNDCDVYRLAQKVILQRDKDRTRTSDSLYHIVDLANANSCTMDTVKAEKEETIVPIFGGGLAATTTTTSESTDSDGNIYLAKEGDKQVERVIRQGDIEVIRMQEITAINEGLKDQAWRSAEDAHISEINAKNSETESAENAAKTANDLLLTTQYKDAAEQSAQNSENSNLASAQNAQKTESDKQATLGYKNDAESARDLSLQYKNDAAVSAQAAAVSADKNTYQGLWPDAGGAAEKGNIWQTQVGGTPTGDYFTALKDTAVDPVDDEINWLRVVTKKDLSLVVYGKRIGIVGDGIADDTEALSLGLNFFGNIDSSKVFQKNVSYILDLTGLKVRYTERLVQAQGCQIKGDFIQALRDIDLVNDKGTILYPDFDDPLRSSIVTACYSLSDNFAPIGTLIDPWDYKVDSSSYNNGRVSRSYGCSIEGVGFYTDRLVGSPYGAAASPSVKANYVHSGFLNAGLFTGCWPCDVKVYGNSYHRGVMMYNCNDRTVDGYISRYSDTSSAPALDDTTDPALVIGQHAIHNPDELRHNTCGVYEAFCNAGEVNATIEKFETSKFRWSCLGTVENSPYVENSPALMYHHVGSDTVVKAPRIGFAGSLGRVSSGGILDIELPAIQQGTIVKLDYGSQVSSGTPARMNITLKRQSDIPDAEKYNPAVSFSFKVPATTIYIDSASGDNSNTGLTLANAVQSLDIALARAEYYGVENIELVSGDVAELSADYLLTSKVRIYPKSGQSTVTPAISGGFIRRIQLGSGADITIDGCAVVLPAGGTSASARGLFRPVEGSSKVSLLNCDTSAEDLYPGLFNSASNAGTYTVFNISGGSVSLEHYGRNDYGGTGQATIIFSKSGAQESGSLNWGSTFKIL